jgi:hypothetical protein
VARRTSPFAALAAAALAAAACSAPVRHYNCAAVTAADVAVDPRTIWTCNVDVIQRIVKGRDFSLREFWGASEFLEKLTGIPADVVDTPHGRIPGPKIATNLRSWTDWYAAHASELTWDATTGTVRLIGASEEG